MYATELHVKVDPVFQCNMGRGDSFFTLQFSLVPIYIGLENVICSLQYFATFFVIISEACK